MTNLSMDANTFALYIHELRNQCMYTEAALGLFNQSMEKQSSTGAFFAAQSFLTSAAHIARLLWPVRKKAQQRGATLRAALSLPDKFPLADDRLRNLWDYSDEKTDDWINTSKEQVIAFDFMGPKHALGDKQPEDKHIYRLFDPEKMHFYYRGEVFNLQEIASQVAAVAAQINKAHDQLFPKKDEEAGNGAANDAEAAKATEKKRTPVSRSRDSRAPRQRPARGARRES